MKLTPAQLQISSDSSRFRVVAAGRRFGKSYLSINELAKYARHPNSRCLYCAPTYRQAKTVIWSDLKGMLIEKRWVKKINESELTVTLINGSTITVRSTDNYDALRGGKYNFIVLDECADMHQDAWFQVLRATLSDMQGDALFIGSPKGRNWFHDLWINGGVESDWASYQFTTLQGGNVPEAEIQSARRDLDERTFQQEYEAAFVNYSGVIFYNWSDERNLKTYDWNQFTPTTPIFCSIDFNNSPITCGVWVKHNDTLHAVDEIEIYGSNTNELVTELKRRYGPNRQYYAYPDATGSRTNTNSNGVSDHIILNNNGIKVIAGKINPNVADSINSVNSMLLDGSGNSKMWLDPKCKRMRECMLKYVYKEGTRVPHKDNINDHFADGIRYIAYGFNPPKVIPQSGIRGKSYRRA